MKRLMSYKKTLLPRVSVVLLNVSVLLTSCHNSSGFQETESSLPLGVTPIETKQSSESTDYSIVEKKRKSVESEIKTDTDTFYSDNFFVLDNSDGFAGVYEIDVTDPMSRSHQWASEHTEALFFDEINTDHWTSEPHLRCSVRWFFGTLFVFSEVEATEHGTKANAPEDDIYSPPSGITVKTTNTIRAIPFGSIPYSDELPINSESEEKKANLMVACLDLSDSAFPMETGYLSSEYDIYHFVGLADCYLDRIPIGGTMNIIASPVGDYVYEYGDLVGPTVGGALITGETEYSRYEDTIIGMYRTRDFRVKNIVGKKQPIMSVLMCRDAIEEALLYDPFIDSCNGLQIYAAELVYMPISEFDLQTRDFKKNGHTYLVPVWNVYYRSSDPATGMPGTSCVLIDAITGKALYSSDYPYQDKRLYEDGI
jgi:hypothetical protein